MKRREAVPSTLGAYGVGELVSFLKITAILDELDIKGAHRRVFLDAVAVGNDYRCPHAVLPSGEADRLTVVSTCRGDYTRGLWTASAELMQIDQSTTNLERASRSVVFVFDPDGSARAVIEQGPPILRGRWHVPIYHRCRLLE